MVVGFAPDGAGGLAKLRLARREGGKLIYAGRVGTGWDYKTARKIRSALTPRGRTILKRETRDWQAQTAAIARILKANLGEL